MFVEEGMEGGWQEGKEGREGEKEEGKEEMGLNVVYQKRSGRKPTVPSSWVI